MRLISREVLRGELCLVNQIRIPFVDRGSARMDTTMDRPQSRCILAAARKRCSSHSLG